MPVPVAARLDTAGETSDDEGELAQYGFSGYGTFACLTARHVPYLIVASDIIFSLGAGMTVQYFALFFVAEFGTSPIGLQAIFVVTPIATFTLIGLGQRLAVPLGRVPVMVLSRVVGVMALFGMVLARSFWLAASLSVVRTSFQRVASPLERSILMDLVPKAQRGRWNALEGINSAAWTGSALLGGFLVDKYSYRACFAITGIFYSCATLLLIPSWYIVPRREALLARAAVPATALLGVDSALSDGSGDGDGCEKESAPLPDARVASTESDI